MPARSSNNLTLIYLAFFLSLAVAMLFGFVARVSEYPNLAPIVGAYFPPSVDPELRPVWAMIAVFSLLLCLLLGIRLAAGLLSKQTMTLLVKFVVVTASALSTWMAVYGLLHDDTLLPSRGLHWVSRARHPGWYWYSEVVWFGFALLLACIPVSYFRRARRAAQRGVQP
jgi:hypothetical protein